MDYAYGEDELYYHHGVTQAIRYYKKLHKLGFEINPDWRYYVDFQGYQISMGGYEEYMYPALVNSSCSPLMGEQGEACYSHSLNGRGVEFFQNKNLYKPTEEEDEEYEDRGVYLHLDHPLILSYLDKYMGTETIKEIEKILEEFRTTADFYIDIEEGQARENDWSMDKDGIYLFINLFYIYYYYNFSSFILELAEAISSRLKKDQEEEGGASCRALQCI